MIAINVPLKILTSQIQDYHTHSSTALKFNPSLKYKATIKIHRFQKYKNNMAYAVPPPTPGGSRTTTSSSNVCITEKLNM